MNMKRCLTGCRLWLAAPAFFLLMQVAVALHHHHFKSFHDDNDSLHSFSATFYPDHIKQDALSCFSSDVLPFTSSYSRVQKPDLSITPFAVLIIDPSQSRAPPMQ
jgi:hypothetical protein